MTAKASFPAKSCNSYGTVCYFRRTELMSYYIRRAYDDSGFRAYVGGRFILTAPSLEAAKAELRQALVDLAAPRSRR